MKKFSQDFQPEPPPPNKIVDSARNLAVEVFLNIDFSKFLLA